MRNLIVVVTFILIILQFILGANVTLIAGGSTAAQSTVNGLVSMYTADTQNKLEYALVGSGGGVTGTFIYNSYSTHSFSLTV